MTLGSSEWVEGRVERVLWASADGDYAVLRVATSDGSLVVVGSLGSIAKDVGGGDAPFVSFEGTFENNPTHGHRFRATGVLIGSPRTDAGLRQYLASSGVRGIGPTMATRIVHHFGQDTIRVLEEASYRLSEVPGIGRTRAEAVAEAWKEDAGARALTILLRGLDVSPRLVTRIRERFGDEAWRRVTTTPYDLEQVRGIGFAIADGIARRQGMPVDHPDRIAAAVRHVVERGRDEGHCYVPERDLTAGLARMQVPVDDLTPVLDRLVAEGRLVEAGGPEGRALAVPRLDRAERLVAAMMARQVQEDEVEDIEEALAEAERWAGLALDESQREAVRLAATRSLTVVTGGPGTGKTTLVGVLLRLAADRGEQWLLASPTGRAAKRLSEATGHEASTLHRLLEFQPGTGHFGKDSTVPLEADGLVVDETSMVDIELMAAVLGALPWNRRCRLVLVGDADQLPSVGPGQVLRDLIQSGVVPVARLRTVHRQGARSGIVRGAAEVHGGAVPTSGEVAGDDDFFVLHRDDPEAVVDTLLAVIRDRLPAKGFVPAEDVQVLAPTRKGPLGVARLNDVLRDALNPSAARVQLGYRAFGVGDRVICTRNRYDHGVFNGDLGRVTAVSTSGLTVAFDEGSVVWPREELDQIELAYALTVHKAQGSEYPAVVLVMHRSHGIMLRRNLLYTALTRARRFFVGLGDRGAWQRAVGQTAEGRRHTRLAHLLRLEVAESREAPPLG